MVYFCAFARSEIFQENARKSGVGRGQFDAGVNGLNNLVVMLMGSSLLLKCKGYLLIHWNTFIWNKVCMYRSGNTLEYCPLNKNSLKRSSIHSLYRPGQGSSFWRFAEHLTISFAPSQSHNHSRVPE